MQTLQACYGRVILQHFVGTGLGERAGRGPLVGHPTTFNGRLVHGFKRVPRVELRRAASTSYGDRDQRERTGSFAQSPRSLLKTATLSKCERQTPFGRKVLLEELYLSSRQAHEV